jgi:hypothetical protein
LAWRTGGRRDSHNRGGLGFKRADLIFVSINVVFGFKMEKQKAWVRYKGETKSLGQIQGEYCFWGWGVGGVAISPGVDTGFLFRKGHKREG